MEPPLSTRYVVLLFVPDSTKAQPAGNVLLNAAEVDSIILKFSINAEPVLVIETWPQVNNETKLKTNKE